MFTLKVVLVIALLAFTPSDALLKKFRIEKSVGDFLTPSKLPGIPILGNLLPSLGAVIGGLPGSPGAVRSEAAAKMKFPAVELVVKPLPGNSTTIKVGATPATQRVEEITPVQRIIPVNAYAVRRNYALPYAYSVAYPYSYTYTNSIPRSLYQVRSGWQ